MKINDKITGRVVFINKNENFYGFVEIYKYNLNNEIVKFEYKNVYNETFISLNARKNNDETYSLSYQESSIKKILSKQ
ncbi:hypothetical protein VOI54_10245 [Tamlana sp. 2201CG12-4]|uniref:hypothetical protein n=1 Tax=Tamlana sp. 2201CG12-4 TaxID=3112582 RepID=UPI002DBC7453|nr:hypothetical protein [Tamlana sp. 2201CG12-4]MEC3907399.1 hypothetical protein [Tamlana sp. 2201CG12-4]